MSLRDLLDRMPGLEDPVNPKIFERDSYVLTDEMRLAFESYGWTAWDIDLAISGLGWFIQGGSFVSEFVASQVRVYAGGKKQLIKSDKAAPFFEKLRATPGVLDSLYDESQMILSAKGVGVANGLVWITPLEGQPPSEKMAMRISALNLPS